MGVFLHDRITYLSKYLFIVIIVQIKKVEQKLLYSNNTVFSARFHYLLLGYRSQQWLLLYNVSSWRILVTNHQRMYSRLHFSSSR
jgi:hypothetical protein